MVQFRKCYIIDDTIYDIEQTLIIDNIKYKIYYYLPIFNIEQESNQYYIILEYDISHDILDRYFKIKDTILSIQLNNDIIELICNNLFGFNNLDFLNSYHPSNHINILINKYILNNKCMFAYNTLKLTNNNTIISKIHKYYSALEYLDNPT